MVEIWNRLMELIDPIISVENIGFILTIIVSFVILIIILRGVKKILLSKVKTKKQVANVTVFIDILRALFAVLFLIIVFSSFANKWGELGFIAGLLTLALGWALQKPISGVVAWLIIVTRRPFNIGDRIIISKITGDIIHISLTHILLAEVGGTIEGEELSRRTVLIPNSIIFEQEVINYSEKDDYILDEIKASITYESDLGRAEIIMNTAVKIVMKKLWEKFPKKVDIGSHTRLNFKDSGIEITVRYNTIATKRNEISTDIRREIHRLVTTDKKVEFAYPHTEVLLHKK